MDVYFTFTNPSGNWIQALSAIAAPIAAFIAIGVAAWQGHLQRQNLKQNLFQQRHAVYLEVRHFLSDYAIKGKTDLNSGIRLLQNTKESEWLFGPEIDSLIQEIYNKASMLRSFENMETGGQPLQPDKRSEMNDLSNWIAVTANTVARQKFTPYLRLYSEPKRRVGRLFRRMKRNP